MPSEIAASRARTGRSTAEQTATDRGASARVVVASGAEPAGSRARIHPAPGSGGGRPRHRHPRAGPPLIGATNAQYLVEQFVAQPRRVARRALRTRPPSAEHSPYWAGRAPAAELPAGSARPPGLTNRRTAGRGVPSSRNEPARHERRYTTSAVRRSPAPNVLRTGRCTAQGICGC